MSHKRALKRSFWASLGKLISIGLAAGAGSLIHDLIGGGFSGWGTAFILSIISFVLMWFSEFERERIS